MTATLFNLITGTRKVLPVTLERLDDGAIKIESIRETEFIGTKTKVYNATTKSATGKGKYTTQIAFFGIDPVNETPDVNKTRVGVRCSCPAYRHYFSHPNKKNKATYGAKFPPYTRKTPPPPEGRPHTNPKGVPGLCKHLALLTRTLRQDDEINA